MQLGPLPDKGVQSHTMENGPKSEHEFFVKAIKKLAALTAETDVNKRLPINMEMLYKLAKEEYGENAHIFVENYLECYTKAFNKFISETLVSSPVSTTQKKILSTLSSEPPLQSNKNPIENTDYDTDEDTSKKAKKSVVANTTSPCPVANTSLLMYTPQYAGKRKFEELDNKKVLKLAHERGSNLGRKGRSPKGLDIERVRAAAKEEFDKFADIYVAEYLRSHQRGVEIYHARMKKKKKK